MWALRTTIYIIDKLYTVRRGSFVRSFGGIFEIVFTNYVFRSAIENIEILR